MENNTNLTFENYIKEYYSSFIRIFNKSSYIDKSILILLRSIHILLVLFILLGVFLPKNHLLTHITVCFIVLFNLSAYNDDTFINNHMFNILNKNKERVLEKDVIRASQLVPLNNKSCKIIVFLLMLLSVFSYIYPEYSLNSLLKKTDNKLKNIDVDENIKNDQLIITEFKLSNKQNNNKFKIVKTNNNINANELVDIDIVRNAKLEPIIIENNNSESINFNNISSDLDIFNKIEPIKVEFVRGVTTQPRVREVTNQPRVRGVTTQPHVRGVTTQPPYRGVTNQPSVIPTRIHKTDINFKEIIPETNNQVNINKIRESLRIFNDISL